MKERVNVTLLGENYLEKFRRLKLAQRDLLLKSKSEIVRIAFEKFYSENVSERKLNKADGTNDQTMHRNPNRPTLNINSGEEDYLYKLIHEDSNSAAHPIWVC